MNRPEYDQVPDEDPTSWNEFEQKLRVHSLGTGPARRDQVLYDCGFAAGKAEAAKELRTRQRLWPALAMAASLLACLSLASNFYSAGTNANHVVLEPSHHEKHDELPEKTAISQPWELAIRSHAQDRHTKSMWRPTTQLSEFQIEPVSGVGASGNPPAASRPLQPSDIQSLFSKGV